jgi:hypothetical protein
MYDFMCLGGVYVMLFGMLGGGVLLFTCWECFAVTNIMLFEL